MEQDLSLARLRRVVDELSDAELERMGHALRDELRRRDIFFGDDLLPTYAVPFIVERSTLDGWRRASQLLVSAVETVARGALEDRALFQALGLRKDAAELLAIDPGFGTIATLCRPDALPRGDSLTFLEFNCDSPAMMAFSDEVAEILLGLPQLDRFRSSLEREQMTRALLDALLASYREFGGNESHPTIAITDFEAQSTRFEHQRIRRQFEAAGYPTFVCDPRAFRRDGQGIALGGRRVHIVYRRALFNELLDHREDVGPLLDAYRHGAVCMVNSLRSYLASSKTLIAYLYESGGRDERLAACRDILPVTRRLTPDLFESLRADRDAWVLKRGESHGGKHVLLPGGTDEAWAEAERDARQVPWIAQQYCAVPRLLLPSSNGDRVERRQKFYNWNPFVFRGRYAGGIARASDTPLINICLGGGLLPTLTWNGATA